MSRKSVRSLRPHIPSRKSHILVMKQLTHLGQCSDHLRMAGKGERGIHQYLPVPQELLPLPDSTPAIPVGFEDAGTATGLFIGLNSPIIQFNRRNKTIFRSNLLLAASVTF